MIFFQRPKTCASCRFCDLATKESDTAACCIDPPKISESGMSRRPMAYIHAPACSRAKKKRRSE